VDLVFRMKKKIFCVYYKKKHFNPQKNFSQCQANEHVRDMGPKREARRRSLKRNPPSASREEKDLERAAGIPRRLPCQNRPIEVKKLGEVREH
jgi:hypothetical protein